MLSQTEAYPLLMGDIDPNGSVNATMLNTFFSPRFRIKAIGRFEKNDLANCQATADWRGDRYTLSLTAANVDLREQSFVGVAHLLGGVTKNLSIGGEIVLQGSPQIPGGFMALPGLGGKYSTDAWTASLSVNPASFHTMYFHQVSKLLQIGVDWQISLRGQEPESVAKIAYHFDMQPAGVAFRGEVSSEWTILATMEKQLGAAPISFVMSCAMSVISRATKVGIGLIVGQG